MDLKDELIDFVNKSISDADKKYETEIFPEDYSIFCELHKLMEDEEEDHNCIGCNLDENALLLYSTLGLLEGYSSVVNKMRMLIITVYLLIERIDTILGIVEIHKGYRTDNFKTLYQVRKWANFVKHPKAFILAHHPIYSIEGFSGNSKLRKEAEVVVDFKFIQKYYSDDKHNDELYKEMQNKEGVLVVFPNPLKLISKLCSELQLFNRILRNNEIYREILKKKSTFLGFWTIEED